MFHRTDPKERRIDALLEMRNQLIMEYRDKVKPFDYYRRLKELDNALKRAAEPDPPNDSA